MKANRRAYRHSTAVTEYKEFPGRTHFIIGQSGWQEVANFASTGRATRNCWWSAKQRRMAREVRARQVA